MKAIEPDGDNARSWLMHSLTAGHQISTAILTASPFDRGRFRTFVSSAADPNYSADFREGGIIEIAAANTGLAHALDELTQKNAACVVIEDDVLGREDPGLAHRAVPSAFIDGRVVHWADLKPGCCAAAVEGIRDSASGYPLNAFIVNRPSGRLGLVDGEPVLKEFVDQIRGSLLAVVCSAFDGESFLLWEDVPTS